MKIDFNIENYTDFNLQKKILKKIFKTLLKKKTVFEKSCLYGLTIDTINIDFVFCDDEFIHKVNKEYRGFDKPTDVISFALFNDAPDKIVMDYINLGEIIISVDTAQKQSKERAHNLDKEIYYLVCHGFLHLLGFDHQTEKEYNFMVEVQDSVLKELEHDQI